VAKLRDTQPHPGLLNRQPTQGLLGGPAFTGGLLNGGPGMIDQMQASSNRFRDVASTQGLAAAMRDPVHEKMGTDIAGAFDFTGGLGLSPAVIRAYHGSPHTFDRFDMSKIGTGEGAQAYGHGLYFAENPKVAEQYRENLSAAPALNAGLFDGDGQPVRASQVADWLQADPNMTDDEMDGFLRILGEESTPEMRSGWIAEGKKRLSDAKNSGATYTVDLDVNHEDLLDWDAPLSQQPEKVRQALAKLGVEEPKGGGVSAEEIAALRAAGKDSEADFLEAGSRMNDERNQMTGAQIYERLGQQLGGMMKTDRGAATQQFLGAGIPGIRYLDGGSRAGGDGTRNFVLFDDQLAAIRERNGQPVR